MTGTLARGRRCLRCGTNLSDTMGCYVFIAGKSVPGALLCVEHGRNGANGLSQATYDYLTGQGALADEITATLLSWAARTGVGPGEALDAAEEYLGRSR